MGNVGFRVFNATLTTTSQDISTKNVLCKSLKYVEVKCYLAGVPL